MVLNCILESVVASSPELFVCVSPCWQFTDGWIRPDLLWSKRWKKTKLCCSGSSTTAFLTWIQRYRVIHFACTLQPNVLGEGCLYLWHLFQYSNEHWKRLIGWSLLELGAWEVAGGVSQPHHFSLCAVRRHQDQPAVRAVQVGHSAGGDRVHGGGDDDVRGAAGRRWSQTLVGLGSLDFVALQTSPLRHRWEVGLLVLVSHLLILTWVYWAI